MTGDCISGAKGATPNRDGKRFELLRQRDGQVVCRPLHIADTFFGRLRGLLGRAGLAQGEGILITPCRDVHTFWMRFPIDIVFLDRARTVVGLRKSTPAWRWYFGGRNAQQVLELAGGAAEELELGIGDMLVLREVNDDV